MTGFFDLQPPITRDDFEVIRTDGRPRRVCFATTHAQEPKRGTAYAGTLNLPFIETVGPLLNEGCNAELWPNRNVAGTFWRSIQSTDEFDRIDAWARAQGTRVFIRDCLDLSVALGPNLVEIEHGFGGHTRLGGLESRAKRCESDAIKTLVKKMAATIRALPMYRDAKLISAVPPRSGKSFDLPTVLTKRIARKLGLEDVTARFRFAATKGTVKAAPVEENGLPGRKPA